MGKRGSFLHTWGGGFWPCFESMEGSLWTWAKFWRITSGSGRGDNMAKSSTVGRKVARLRNSRWLVGLSMGAAMKWQSMSGGQAMVKALVFILSNEKPLKNFKQENNNHICAFTRSFWLQCGEWTLRREEWTLRNQEEAPAVSLRGFRFGSVDLGSSEDMGTESRVSQIFRR